MINGLALSGRLFDVQLFPFLALPFSPDRGKSFPKGGALGKEGKLFLYPLYSFALAIC